MAGKYYGSQLYDEHMASIVISFMFQQIWELQLWCWLGLLPGIRREIVNKNPYCCLVTYSTQQKQEWRYVLHFKSYLFNSCFCNSAHCTVLDVHSLQTKLCCCKLVV